MEINDPKLEGWWAISGLPQAWIVMLLFLGQVGDYVTGELNLEINQGPFSFAVAGSNLYPNVILNFEGREPFTFDKRSFSFEGRFHRPEYSYRHTDRLRIGPGNSLQIDKLNQFACGADWRIDHQVRC
jgi:hypothetical protein